MSTQACCFRCQRHPDAGEPPFQRCGRCKTRNYCSRDCQKLDWKTHKQECRPDAVAGPPPERILTEGPLPGTSDDPLYAEIDKIHYLKTSKPHVKDVSISGPYIPIEAAIEQMFARMVQEESPTGVEKLRETIKKVPLTSGFQFDAPLPGGHVMNMRIESEENAEVAAFLLFKEPGEPRPTFVVCSFHTDDEAHGSFDTFHVATRDAGAHGTFLTAEAANACARALMARWKREVPGTWETWLPRRKGLLQGCLTTARGPERLVVVRLEDGAKQLPDGTIDY